MLAQEGVFHLRLCKLCDDGVVVKGEYGLTTALFAHGFNIATLMGMYPPDLDWRDQRHWNCNNNVHPSRHGRPHGMLDPEERSASCLPTPAAAAPCWHAQATRPWAEHVPESLAAAAISSLQQRVPCAPLCAVQVCISQLAL